VFPHNQQKKTAVYLAAGKLMPRCRGIRHSELNSVLSSAILRRQLSVTKLNYLGQN
jgi:hypothetical protein